MPNVITTGNYPKALWPGMKRWWGRAYDEPQKVYSQIFDITKSNKRYEEYGEATGFGTFPEKSQGASIAFDTESQGTLTKLTNITYSLGFIVTEEEIDDCQYMEVGKRRTKALAFSARTTKEIHHANIFNRAFDSNYTMEVGDGIQLCATTHGTFSGNQSNKLAIDADFSESAVEDLDIQIEKANNSRGLRIALRTKSVLIPTDLKFESYRILKSTLQSGTANNDVNALNSMGAVPKIIRNTYLTDTDAWFLLTNIPSESGLVSQQRKPMKFAQDNDFDTSNLKVKAGERYVPGWIDFRSVYGSAGA